MNTSSMSVPAKREAQRPALPSTSSPMGKVVSHLTQDVRPTLFSETQLVLLTFCTGIQGRLCRLRAPISTDEIGRG